MRVVDVRRALLMDELNHRWLRVELVMMVLLDGRDEFRSKLGLWG